MKRVCIICEGHTELVFVERCIKPHLALYNQDIRTTLLKKHERDRGGGSVSLPRLVQHIKMVYGCFDYISTFVDLYGFQGAKMNSKQQLEFGIVDTLTRQITNFDKTKVIPYVQQYEFEALLFADVNQFVWVLDGWNEAVRNKLQAIRDRFDSPEDINNSKDTAPSKRIMQVFGEGIYSKDEFGPIIAEEIGLACIRHECPHFDQWISSLEALGRFA